EYSQGAEGPAMTAFERVPRTDITILAFRSTKGIQAARTRTLLFGVLASFGLMLLSVSGVWWIVSRYGSEASVAPTSPQVSFPMAIPSTVSAPSLQATKGTLTADVPLRIASALGHELK